MIDVSLIVIKTQYLKSCEANENASIS